MGDDQPAPPAGVNLAASDTLKGSDPLKSEVRLPRERMTGPLDLQSFLWRVRKQRGEGLRLGRRRGHLQVWRIEERFFRPARGSEQYVRPLEHRLRVEQLSRG